MGDIGQPQYHKCKKNKKTKKICERERRKPLVDIVVGFYQDWPLPRLIFLLAKKTNKKTR